MSARSEGGILKMVGRGKCGRVGQQGCRESILKRERKKYFDLSSPSLQPSLLVSFSGLETASFQWGADFRPTIVCFALCLGYLYIGASWHKNVTIYLYRGQCYWKWQNGKMVKCRSIMHHADNINMMCINAWMSIRNKFYAPQDSAERSPRSNQWGLCLLTSSLLAHRTTVGSLRKLRPLWRRRNSSQPRSLGSKGERRRRSLKYV